jgi:hypothetical protein
MSQNLSPRQPGHIDFLYQQPGDIVLVSDRKFGPVIRLAQTMASGKAALYSHTMLCVMPGLFIHATTPGGVGFVAAEDPSADFQSRYDHAWCVRRHASFAADDHLRQQVSQRAAYYLGQGYNWMIVGGRFLGLPYEQAHSYCSELVAKVYRDVDPVCLATAEPPDRILPVHLAALTEGPQWTDVTERYRAGREALPGRLADPFRIDVPDGRLWFIKIVTMMIRDAKSFASVSELLNDLALLGNDLAARLPSMSDEERIAFGNAMGFDERSFRHQIDTVLDLLYGGDRLLIQEQKGKRLREPLHFTQALAPPLPEHDSQRLLDRCRELLAAIARHLIDIARGAVGATEAVVNGIALRRLTDAGPGASDIQLIAQMRGLLGAVAPFDNYTDDLKAATTSIEDRLREQPLYGAESRRLARWLLAQMQWRLALASESVDRALSSLEQDPLDFDAAYRLYTTLLALPDITEPAAGEPRT